MAAGYLLVPAIRDGSANEDPHQASCEPIEDHNDCNAIRRIAVSFLGEYSQIQTQNRQLRQQGREKVEKFFREDEFEPDNEFTLCRSNSMAASMTILDKDWGVAVSEMKYERPRVDERAIIMTWLEHAR